MLLEFIIQINNNKLNGSISNMIDHLNIELINKTVKLVNNCVENKKNWQIFRSGGVKIQNYNSRRKRNC